KPERPPTDHGINGSPAAWDRDLSNGGVNRQIRQEPLDLHLKSEMFQVPPRDYRVLCCDTDLKSKGTWSLSIDTRHNSDHVIMLPELLEFAEERLKQIHLDARCGNRWLRDGPGSQDGCFLEPNQIGARFRNLAGHGGGAFSRLGAQDIFVGGCHRFE